MTMAVLREVLFHQFVDVIRQFLLRDVEELHRRLFPSIDKINNILLYNHIWVMARQFTSYSPNK